MRYPDKRNAPGGGRSSGLYSRGQEVHDKYNPNAAPAQFWKGFGGTESMAPQIHRKPPKPCNTLWNPPKVKGGAR